jgi:hypothetical protein
LIVTFRRIAALHGSIAARDLLIQNMQLTHGRGERRAHAVWTLYASLSTIARAITGTVWSGPRFFGLRAGANRLKDMERGRRSRRSPTV